MSLTNTVITKHPLPWSAKVLPSPIGYTNTGTWDANSTPTILVDARGDEVKLDASNISVIAEITKQLTAKQLRRLGQRPTGLFVVKNKNNGVYLCGRDITRTQHYLSRYQAQKCVNRLNNGTVNNYVVVELDIKEKV